MNITSTAAEKVHLKIAPTDKAGKASKVKDPVFDLLSGDATIVADADGLGAFVVPGDTPGEIVVNVKGKPDLTGVDQTELMETVNYTTTAPLATDLGLTADAPVAKA